MGAWPGRDVTTTSCCNRTNRTDVSGKEGGEGKEGREGGREEGRKEGDTYEIQHEDKSNYIRQYP